MTIQSATYNETQFILNHAINVFTESTVGHIEPSWDKALQSVSLFLNNGGYYFINTENNKIKGWIGIGVTYDSYTDKEIGFIQELYVLPEYRNAGIARELCKEATIHLKQQGCQEIQLNVFVGNGAKNLYRKLGFQDLYTTMKLDFGSNTD
ncbi:GNAT family N-acetyltransferase [Ornithinibacillus xuwenensis]|jgi:ribosomal protein S18 acetylase RimI-like enzyme|uniref:GNAT family N-acetyltransferase n=1 Tax=Ornithinibacillus xuwenensis TaxID=3144668 RepID=A0ABU9XH81_9BACI